MKKITPSLLCLYLSIASFSSMANTAGEHSHAAIRQGIEQFLLAESASRNLSDIKVQVGSLDPRMRLRQCTQALEFDLPEYSQFSGKVTVEVKCQDKSPWKLYIQAKIQAFREVLVTGTSLERGQLITASNVRREKRDISAISSGYIKTLQQAAGKVTRRSLRAGTVLNQRHLKTAKLVKRGQSVVLMAETNGIQVKMSGKALNDAGMGERVRVLNYSSKRIVEGNATEKGIVKVSM